MSFSSFDIDSFTFKNPEQLGDTELFICKAISNSDKPLQIFFSGNIKITDINNNLVILSQNNNDIIKFTNKLYLECLDKIFSLAKDWFESEISKEDIKKV